jgi:signal transduction histidine kinase
MRRASSIRTKLLSLLAAPLVVLAVLAGLGVRWSSDAAARSRAAERSTEAALVSTAAALEVSSERGLSVAVLAGREGPAGEGAAAELRFQRGQTDVAIQRLASTLTDRAAADSAVTEVRNALDALRRGVDGGEVTADAALDQYSTTVDRLLATVAAGTDAIDDPDLAATASSYLALTRATDAVARQQSLLMSAFAAGVIDAASRDQIVAAGAAETLWRERFERGATVAQRAAYTEALSSPSVAAADELRADTLALGPNAPVPDAGRLWFTSAGRKVDVLNAVADEIAAELATTAADRRIDAERQRLLLVALGVAAVGMIVGLLFVLDRLIVRPIRRLTSAAHDVAREVLPRAVAVAHTHGAEAAEATAPPLVATTQDELGALTDAFNSVQRTAVALAAEQATLRRNVSDVFVNLGRRTQNLITRQLDHIDHLETGTDDPDALSDLFLLDHLATRLRRNAENMLVLAGAASPRPWARPVSIVNVVRAALAESTDYARVEIERLEAVSVIGAAVSDLSHLVAELVDNALAFSPPTERVVVTGRWAHDGRYAVSITDHGIGMPPERLAEANARINDPPIDEFAVSKFLGLYVVGRLADRHGAAVMLAEAPLGGVTAHVLLPAQLIVTPTTPPTRGVIDTSATVGPAPSPAYARTRGAPPAAPRVSPTFAAGGPDG